MKRLSKENVCVLASALLAGAFYLFVCFYFKVFPFGTEYTLLKIDLCHQYAPMLTQMYDLVKSGNGIFYSWASGLGYSFFGNFLNYLASPFNLIIFLFKRENIVDSISIIILLKTFFISGCFSQYLSKTFKRSDALNVAFSLLYTFSGWFVAYSWNIMWLDILFCLPLAALGVQRIINEKRSLMYFVVLVYAILTNYYMAYMLCVFLCIYFIYWYVQNNEVKNDLSIGFFKSNLFKSGLRFVISSLAAACTCAVVLVPIYCLLRSSSATGDSFNKGLGFHFDFFSFLAQQFSGCAPIVTGTIRKNANAWCGMIPIILIPAYFFSKSFSKKERITDLCIIGFLILSLSFNALSFVWNGFHFANGLEDRFAYYYVFLALTVAFKTIEKVPELNKYIAVISSSLACIFITVMFFIKPENVEKYTVIISIGFTVIWLVMFFVSRMKNIDFALIRVVVLFFVCLEMIFANLLDFDYNIARYHYDRDYTNFSHAIRAIEESDNELFYRVEKTDSKISMEPMVLGYNGITNFSSVTKESVAKNQSALGLDSNNINSFMYFYQTPVYNSIFGLKYIFDGDDSVKDQEYDGQILSDGKYIIYQNNYYLPLGYCADNELVSFKSQIGTNPFYQQNNMFKLMSNTGDLFNYCQTSNIKTSNVVYKNSIDETTKTEKIIPSLENNKEKGFVEYSFEIRAGEDYYFYLSYKASTDEVELTGLSEKISILKDHAVGIKPLCAIIPLGIQKEDATFTVRFPVNEKTEGEPISVYLASFNKDKFIEGYNKLSQHTLNLTEFGNTHFKGTVTADKKCLLFTSIPYDKGWHITLDGKPVDESDVIAIDDAYISVPLTKGEHTVEFDYFPQGLKAGACISAVTVCGLTAYLIIDRKKKKQKEK